MADVSRGAGWGTRDGAQLLLTAAFVISVLFVALALLLNSAIFTENLSARGSAENAGHAAVQLRADAAATTAETLRSVNAHNNTTHATLQRNLSAAVADWHDMVARHDAVTGGSTTLSLVATTNGSYVRQSTAGRNFTDGQGDRNWTLVTGADDVRAFRVAVDRPSLVDPAANESVENLTDAGVFRVVVSGASETRRVFVYRDGAGTVETVVGYDNGTLSAVCETASGSDPVTLDLPNASVGGDHCEPLAFFDGVSGGYTIRYEIGPSAAGTYSLVVDGDASTVPDANYDDLRESTGPFATERINAATVRLVHETDAMRYRVTMPVTPGGVDD